MPDDVDQDSRPTTVLELSHFVQDSRQRKIEYWSLVQPPYTGSVRNIGSYFSVYRAARVYCIYPTACARTLTYTTHQVAADQLLDTFMTLQTLALSRHVSRYIECLCIIHVRPVEVDTTSTTSVAGSGSCQQYIQAEQPYNCNRSSDSSSQVAVLKKYLVESTHYQQGAVSGALVSHKAHVHPSSCAGRSRLQAFAWHQTLTGPQGPAPRLDPRVGPA